MLTHLSYSVARLRRQEDGQSISEFAIALPLILFLVICLVQLGFGVSDQLDEMQLASQAARLAAVNSTALSGGVQAYVRSQTDYTNLQNSTVAVCFPNGTANVGDPVEVSVSSSFKVTPFISATIPVKGTATMRLEQTPTTFGASGSC